MKNFNFTAAEASKYQDMITIQRKVNAAQILTASLLNACMSSPTITTIGFGCYNGAILYKNLHQLDIDTSIYEGYSLKENSTIQVMIPNDEVSISYILEMDLTTIPKASEADIDDSIGLNLKIAVPMEAITYFKDNNIDCGYIFQSISNKVGIKILEDFTSTYQFDGNIGE